MVATYRVAAGLVAVLVVVGCTSDGDEDADASRAVEAIPSSVPASPSPSATPSAPAPPAPARCAVDDRDVMRDAVDAQLAAITAGDWAAALTFTSSAFRAEVDEDSFEQLIVTQFPVVAGAVGADATSCLLAPTGDAASLSVTVEDGDGTQQELAYLFQRESGAWLIGGAVERDPDDDPTTTTI